MNSQAIRFNLGQFVGCFQGSQTSAEVSPQGPTIDPWPSG